MRGVFAAIFLMILSGGASATTLSVDFSFFISSGFTGTANLFSAEVRNSSTAPGWDLVGLSILTDEPRVGLGMFEDSAATTSTSAGSIDFGDPLPMLASHSREVIWSGALAQNDEFTFQIDTDVLTSLGTNPWLIASPAGSFVGATLTVTFASGADTRTLTGTLGDIFDVLPVGDADSGDSGGLSGTVAVPAPALVGGLAMAVFALGRARRIA